MDISGNGAVFLACIALLLANVSAQSCANFTLVNTAGFWDNFTTIELGPLRCPADRTAAIPLAIHWHVTPKAGANLTVSSNIEGLVVPSVSGGVLSFAYGNALTWRGGSAGVEIVCPAGNLTTISSTAAGNSVEVTDNTGTLKLLEDRGDNNSFYVTSTAAIQFASDSVNGTAEILAPTVTVKMGGTAGEVHVKGATNAVMRGVNNRLVVEGNVTAVASGVANSVLATSGCGFTDTGVDNTCQVTDVTVTVTEMACRGPEGTAFCEDDSTLIMSSSATTTFVVGALAIACGASLLAVC